MEIGQWPEGTKSKRPPSRFRAAFCYFLGVDCAGLVLTFDAVMVSNAVRPTLALGYFTLMGVMPQSEVERTSTRGGYRPHVSAEGSIQGLGRSEGLGCGPDQVRCLSAG
jgi:hypothetical protein